MKRALALAALAASLAVVAAGAAVAHQRRRQTELSPLPSVDNAGPRGLAAARAWLAARGQPPARLAAPGDRPRPGAVVVLAAPLGQLQDGEAAELVAHAERGGLLVWAAGPAPQPALERRLGAVQVEPRGDLGARGVAALAPHPLFAGLALRSGGATVAAGGADALPVAGAADFTAAVSFARGQGEILVLAGPDLLENYRIAEGDNLSLWARLAARGPIAFDERWLAARGGAIPPSRLALALVAVQAILAGAALALGRARRLGAIRPPPALPPGRTARDYLASLGALYRRAGAEGELAASAWRRVRRALDRRAGISARLPDDEAEHRLAARSPPAAAAVRRGRAALAAPPGAAALLEVTRAAAGIDAAIGRARPSGSPPPRTVGPGGA